MDLWIQGCNSSNFLLCGNLATNRFLCDVQIFYVQEFESVSFLLHGGLIATGPYGE